MKISDIACFLRQGLRDSCDFFFPPRCLACREPVGSRGDKAHFVDTLFCGECAAEFQLTPAASCPYCGQHGVESPRNCSRCHGRRRGFQKAVAGAAYKGIVRDMVLRLKFGGQTGMAYPLALCVLHGLESIPEVEGFSCVVAVPLHPSRRRARGYNQAELIARIVAARKRIPFLPGVVGRCRNTLPQGAGGGGSRRGNVKGAFEPVRRTFLTRMKGEVSAEAVRGSRVILVDDVLSTGATMEECAATLRRAGAKYVLAATAAT